MFDNILMGLDILISWQNLLISFCGVAMGITFGALPGFTAAMGVAVLIPITFGMNPVTGLVLLAAEYCGAIYGGSIAAILLNTPGTPSSAATAIDGYEMTKQGKAGEALTEAVCSSFWGGIISALALLFIAPMLAKAALKFGPPEYFMLAIFGLTIIATIMAKSMLKGILSGLIGLFLGTIGLDPLIAFPRFTLGRPELLMGVTLIPTLIGLFSISQVMIMVSEKNKIIETETGKVKKRSFVISDLWRYPIVYIRSAIIGTFVGMLPGAGGSIASFMGYNEAHRFSKTPEKFGTGYRLGVGASEAANNGITGGTLITLLTLGIPGNSVTAILLGGIMIQGLRPGPQLFTQNADVTYPFILSLFLANIFMLIIALNAAPYFAKVTKIPINILAPIVLILGFMGSFAITNSIFDIYLALLFGVLGYILRKHKFSVISVVLGLILGPIAEDAFNQSLVLAKGNNLFVFFMHRPITLILLALVVISLLTPFVRNRLSKEN